MKLNATGTALVYSTYLGPVLGNGIAVDTTGNAYITGQANGDYPTTPGAFQTVSGGSSEAFVTKLNPTGTALVYSTFLGGSGFDIGSEIAIELSGQRLRNRPGGSWVPSHARGVSNFFQRRRLGYVCNEAELDGHGAGLLDLFRRNRS